MVVGRDYLLKKRGGPTASKQFLDTRIIPRAVNTAGSVEVALDRIAARTGMRPGLILMSGAGVMSAVLYGLWMRHHGVEDNRFRHGSTMRESEPLS